MMPKRERRMLVEKIKIEYNKLDKTIVYVRNAEKRKLSSGCKTHLNIIKNPGKIVCADE